LLNGEPGVLLSSPGLPPLLHFSTLQISWQHCGIRNFAEIRKERILMPWWHRIGWMVWAWRFTSKSRVALSAVEIFTAYFGSHWVNLESLWHAKFQGEQIHCDGEHADFINNVVLTWIWIWIISIRESRSWLYFDAPSAVHLLLLLLWGRITFVLWKRQMNTAPKSRLHFSLSQDLFDKSRLWRKEHGQSVLSLSGFIMVLAYA
jgi:hypothetical protein